MTRVLLCLILIAGVARAEKPWRLDTLEPAPQTAPPTRQESRHDVAKPKHAPTPVVPMAPSGVVGSNAAGVGVQTDEKAKPVVRLKFHHSLTGCAPCIPVDAWVKKHKAKIICEVIDVPYANLDAAIASGWPVPTFELIDKKDQTIDWRYFSWESKHSGETVCPGCLNAWIQAVMTQRVAFERRPDELVAASRPVKLPFRSQVQRAFNVARQAGITRFSIQHHCDDGDRVLRVMGRNKSKPGLLAVCGRSGHVSIEAPGSLIPGGRLGFGYRIYSETRVGIDPDEVIIDWGTPKATASQQACGFGLEVLGLISFVGGLLQSNVEITLPRDIALAGEFAGNKVAAAFADQQAPFASMHISSWWERRAYFTSLDVSDVEATLRTNGRWPLPKKQTVQWE